MPKISVILPVYNGALYLKSAIQSVLDQSFVDFELIIVDDCSTDASGDIAKQSAAVDDRVSYHRNDRNLKLPLSLNKGFSMAKGEYLSWTSCDNIYAKNALQTMCEALENAHNVGLVYASMHIINERDDVTGCVEAGPQGDLIFRNVVGACFLYRKSVSDKVGDYDPNLFLCEDYDYWLRIASTTEIRPLLTCLYYYRRHDKSLSHHHEKEIISRGLKVQRRYYPLFVNTRKKAALFYAHMRARDIYNPVRQFYLLLVLFYHPSVFCSEVYGLIIRRFTS